MSEPTATTSEIKTTGSKTAAELEKQLMRAKQLIVVLCMVIALLLGALVTLWAVGGDKEATTGQAQAHLAPRRATSALTRLPRR